MPADSTKLKGFMEKYFGPMGGFLLEKELKAAGITDLADSDELSRMRLAEGIYRDCLVTIMSEPKAKFVFAELQSILGVTIPPIEGPIRHASIAMNEPFERF